MKRSRFPFNYDLFVLYFFSEIHRNFSAKIYKMQVQKSKIFSSFKDIVNMPVVPLMVVVI